MSIIKYEIGKVYRVRNGGIAVIGQLFADGRAYGIYSHDAADDYAAPMVWMADGECQFLENDAFDILPPEPEKRTVWIAVQRVDGKLCAAASGTGGCETRGEALNLWGSPGDRPGRPHPVLTPE